MNKIRILISFGLAFALVLLFVIPSFAATTATVTVTATPAYIAITITPTTYTINSHDGGNSALAINTTYYTQASGYADTVAPGSTVADADCQFSITNTSSISTDLTGNMSDGSGGSNPMTNVNGATAGASSYSAYAYYSGETFASKVLLKSSASTLANFSSNLGATTNIKVGFQFSTQTGAWTGGTGSSYTLTITATAH
jgi:hypothetical protein